MADTFDMDMLARERISSDLGTNFFVEAGAGSGKTTQLVARMTAMIKSGVDVRKICAITFTKAAAREFYKRFQEALAIEVENSTDETERSRCVEALNNIDLCFMGTIDSFSHLILHEHPIDGHIPSNSSVTDDDKMTSVYMREYSKLVRGEYGEALLCKYKDFCKFQKEPERAFKALIGQIINSRSSRLIYPASIGTDVNEVLKAQKSAFLQALDCLMIHEECWGTIKECQASNEALRTNYSTLKGDWAVNTYQIITILSSLEKFRITVEPSEIGIIDTAMFQKLNPRSGIAYKLDIENSELLRILKEMQYYVTLDFLDSAARSIADKLREKGNLTYFDYKLYLRDMLRRDTENGGNLIRHIYERHSYFLIDEFQDTDPMQAEIFFYLSAEKPVADWRSCVPRQGSLFIVGDPKQSIYRFRSADVAAFKDVRSLFENGVGEVLQLTRNYRSTVRLKNWFNTRFAELLPSDTPQQSMFSSIPIEGSEDKEIFSGIWSYNVAINKTSLLDGEEKTADIIERLVANPNCLVKTKNDREPRMLRYSDFMIIFRSKTGIVDYLREFNDRSIPTMVEGRISFSECPALLAMASIMDALAAPHCQTAVYGALTSDIFRITDEEITELRNRGIWLDLRNCDKIEDIVSKRLSDSILTLKSLSLKAVHLSPAAVFNMAMDELRVLQRTGTDRLEYLYFALEMLRSAEISSEVSGIRDASSFIRSLIEDNAHERCISLVRNDDRIHIANLHKVKGLEAPVVILVKPYSRSHNPDDRTEHTSEGSKRWIFNLCKSTSDGRNITYASTNSFQPVYNSEVESMAAEDVRLLYVAATRARNALIIAQAIKADGTRANNNPWEPLISNTDGDFFECIQPNPAYVSTNNVKHYAADLYDEAEKQDIFSDSPSEIATYNITLPSRIKLNKVTSEESDTSGIQDRKNAALVGTMVHRLMECIVSADAFPPAEELINNILNSYGAEEGYAKPLLNVYKQVKNGGFTQNNGVCADILAELKCADEVYCEVPFCHKVSEPDGSFTLWNGVIDLLYKKDGKWRIVDYKTNAEAEQLEYKYYEQLSAYKNAFKAISGEDADTFIYHIDI